MINVKRINSVSVAVRDLERSMAWYREKLGLEKLYDDAPNSPGVIVGKDDVELTLRPLSNPNTATQVDTANQVSIPLLAFEVEPGELDRVKDVFSEDPDIVVLDDHPKYRSRIVEDPDGHAIEFYATH